MKKSNIIDTFVDRRKAQILEQEEDDDIIYDDLFEQTIDLSRFAMHLIEAGLEEYGVDFNYKENPNLRSDMFVILNMLVATLLREQGIAHVLQPELNKLNTRILKMEKYKDDTD